MIAARGGVREERREALHVERKLRWTEISGEEVVCDKLDLKYTPPS